MVDNLRDSKVVVLRSLFQAWRHSLTAMSSEQPSSSMQDSSVLGKRPTRSPEGRRTYVRESLQSDESDARDSDTDAHEVAAGTPSKPVDLVSD